MVGFGGYFMYLNVFLETFSYSHFGYRDNYLYYGKKQITYPKPNLSYNNYIEQG